MKKPTVINLFGGPSCGKSTGAAYIFSQLKMAGLNCEYISEFAKDKTWERNNTALGCQEFVFGNQSYKMQRCKDQVDIIITDSPLILSNFYNSNPILGKEFEQVVLNVFNNYNNFNYFLERSKPYNPAGRWQTENEAKDIDGQIKNYLNEHNIPFKSYKGTPQGYWDILFDFDDKTDYEVIRGRLDFD